MSWSVLLRRLLLLVILVIFGFAGFVAACTPARHLLVTADSSPSGPEPEPDLFAELGVTEEQRLAAWEALRPRLQAELDATIYGRAPAPGRVRQIGQDSAFGSPDLPGERRLRQIEIRPEGGDALTLDLALITPANGVELRGVFLLPYECGLRSALRDESLPEPAGFTPGYCNAEGFLADLIGPMFGEWVGGPPVEWILERGYAVASWHESDIAPDNPALHHEALSRLGLDPEAPDRPGSVSLWAWTISRVIDALEQDGEFADVPMLTLGHSRRGKAVLLAAARDRRVSVTIAHQAGTAGGALHGDGVGEPIAAITDSDPHWFTPAYAGYSQNERALPVDQHALIALAAPNAVLLGNAWRDTWADPSGAWRAAQAASNAWTLYGESGLVQQQMRTMNANGHLAMHIRPGTHGVTGEDWCTFLDFADAHTAPR